MNKVKRAPNCGDEIMAQGTPEDVATVVRSYTRQYLKPLLKGRAPEKVALSRKLKAAE